MAYIFEMESKDGDKIYPVCHYEGVFDKDGNSADKIMESQQAGIRKSGSDAQKKLDEAAKKYNAETEKKIEDSKNELKNSFQDGVDTIYKTIVAQGTTPKSKSLQDILDSIDSLKTNSYNQGYNQENVYVKFSFTKAHVSIIDAQVNSSDGKTRWYSTVSAAAAASPDDSGNGSETYIRKVKVTFNNQKPSYQLISQSRT